MPIHYKATYPLRTSEPEVEQTTTLLPATGYSADLSWTDKLLFALRRIGKGTVKEISEEIMKLEPTRPSDNIKKSVTLYASKLNTEGVLEGKRSGKMNIYTIK